VVDQHHVHSLETSLDGVVHSLATSLEGVSAEDVNCRLADVQILTGIAMYSECDRVCTALPLNTVNVVPSSPVFDHLPDDEIPF
jgi:hypothetical protein